jgi:cellulose synthase/poly-beta-1,6-N-acetylglucosamine synthase-like glycosyltransferase
MIRELVTYAGLLFAVTSVALVIGGHRLRREYHLLSPLVLGLLAGIAAYLTSLLTHGPVSWYVLVLATMAAGFIAVTALPAWNALGQSYFLAVVTFAIAFAGYAAYVTFTAHLGPLSLTFSIVLLVLEVVALVLFIVSAFEVVDVCCRTQWNHRWEPASATSDDFTPFVSLHVPTYNEPPDVVIRTLDHLAQLDYPAFEVLVIDNNTKDERLWRPVEEHCARLGPQFRFFHVDPWPGFKSGALNFALSQTDPRAELVGVVDADYLVEPDFLRHAVAPFAAADVGFVQSPQDYHSVELQGRYGRALYLAYSYFFRLSMTMRNEYNSIIFVGTMGLVRRDVLTSVGGWDEWCLTEDAELSMRVLAAGYRAVYLERTYGRGLMPFDFAALKRQRFRWAFGGMQLLRLHARLLLFGTSRSGDQHLTVPQRLAFFFGGTQWLGDLLTLAFTILLLFGAGALLLGGSLYIQPLVGAAMILPLMLMSLGLVRYLWAFRVRTGCTLREACDALTISFSLSWVVTLACVLGLTQKRGVFLRTPKQREHQPLWQSLSVVRWEALLAGLCVGMACGLAIRYGGLSGPALAVVLVLLTWHALIYGSSVQAVAWSLVTPDDARARERASRIMDRLGAFVTETRPVAVMGTAVLVLLILFVAAIRLAPLEERMYRTDPAGIIIGGGELLPHTPSDEVATIVFLEEQAALNGDIDAALALWHPEGELIDANGTPDNRSDDIVWRGVAEIRRRYEQEFAARRYVALQHERLAFTTDGTTAMVVNDLRATYVTDAGMRSIYLVGSDEWTLVRDGRQWRIQRLVVNRSSSAVQRQPAGQFASACWPIVHSVIQACRTDRWPSQPDRVWGSIHPWITPER